MTTTSNGTSTVGRTFFRYLRPAVNGFGASDEPDPEVAKALDELVALLEKGFVDKGNKDDDRLVSLINKLKTLEDESRNGTSEANEKLKNEINNVKKATQFVAGTESQALIITREISDAKELLNRLLKKLPSKNDNKPDQGDRAENSDETQSTGDDIKRASDFAGKKDSIEDKIKEVRAYLLEKQRQQKKIDEQLVNAKNELIAKRAYEQQATVTLTQISEKVKADTNETLRAIQKLEEEESDFKIYGEILKLENLPGKNGPRTKFKIKIGSDPKLNSPFILVEDKLLKSTLTFNTALFMRQDVIVEYIFLRTYLIEGLRDANAIFDRMTDEKEGGVKYLYDYIVKKVVTKMINTKKLRNE